MHFYIKIFFYFGLIFISTQINNVIKICAAILHLGNVAFTPKFKRQTNEMDQESCHINVSSFIELLFYQTLKS